jgi:hypothetical protein
MTPRKLKKFHEVKAAAELIKQMSAPVGLTAEEKKAYEELQEVIFKAMDPSDAIEILLVDDAVRHTWDLFSSRRGKDQLFLTSSHRGAYAVIEPLLGAEAARNLAEAWRKRLPEAVETMDTILTAVDLTGEAIRVETLAKRLHDFERIDRLTAASEARRNSAFRELHRHRAASTAQRRAVAEIEGEFIEPPDAAEPWPTAPLGDDDELRFRSGQSARGTVREDERLGRAPHDERLGNRRAKDHPRSRQ